MGILNRLMSGTVLSVALLAGGLAPTYADKISSGGKNPPIVTTAPIPNTGSAATDAAAVDFGDDSSKWAKDGECDDPRFSGTGSAVELVDADLLKDATDCKAAYDAGTVTVKDMGSTATSPTTDTSPTDIEIASPIDAIDFGDDSSEWANDGECDDPRFMGTGTSEELVNADIRKDATDCRAAYAAGTVSLKAAGATPTETSTTPTTTPSSPTDITIATPIDAIDFGDDSSEYAKDGECDDPRFTGRAMGAEPLQSNIRKDATDCRAAYAALTIKLNPGADTNVVETINTPPTDPADIDYGDDTSQWAKDDECDDPRFSGTGVADQLLDEDNGHDASDCRAAVAAGTATYHGDSTVITTPAVFDYGGDYSKWANDGVCDDLRFTGTGVDKKLLPDDMSADATDCRAAVDAGTATIRKVYSPEYAAGAPYDGAAIEFGNNTSDYADDQICDDPRFEGPGAASILLEDDLKHDSADCKTAYEEGRVVLIETDNG